MGVPGQPGSEEGAVFKFDPVAYLRAWNTVNFPSAQLDQTEVQAILAGVPLPAENTQRYMDYVLSAAATIITGAEEQSIFGHGLATVHPQVRKEYGNLEATAANRLVREVLLIQIDPSEIMYLPRLASLWIDKTRGTKSMFQPTFNPIELIAANIQAFGSLARVSLKGLVRSGEYVRDLFMQGLGTYAAIASSRSLVVSKIARMRALTPVMSGQQEGRSALGARFARQFPTYEASRAATETIYATCDALLSESRRSADLQSLSSFYSLITEAFFGLSPEIISNLPALYEHWSRVFNLPKGHELQMNFARDRADHFLAMVDKVQTSGHDFFSRYTNVDTARMALDRMSYVLVKLMGPQSGPFIAPSIAQEYADKMSYMLVLDENLERHLHLFIDYWQSEFPKKGFMLGEMDQFFAVIDVLQQEIIDGDVWVPVQGIPVAGTNTPYFLRYQALVAEWKSGGPAPKQKR